MKTKILIATLALSALLTPGQAEIIYSGNSIVIPADLEGVYLNPFSGVSTNLAPGDLETAPWFNPFLAGDAIYTSSLLRPIIVVNGSGNSGGAQVANLAGGTLIDEFHAYAFGANGSSGDNGFPHLGPAGEQFQFDTAGYIGFAMKSSPGSATHYGWVSVTFTNGLNGPGSINGYAYESTPNTPIAAGQISAVPEPTSAVMIGMAFLVWGGRRRSRCK